MLPGEAGVMISDDGPTWLAPACTAYFRWFDPPVEGKCSCGRWIGGVFGSFTWGIVHGEGFCGACRRPARAYHFLKDPSGEEFATLRTILFYRPEALAP